MQISELLYLWHMYIYQIDCSGHTAKEFLSFTSTHHCVGGIVNGLLGELHVCWTLNRPKETLNRLTTEEVDGF